MTRASRPVILAAGAAAGLLFFGGCYHPLTDYAGAEALIVLYQDGSTCKGELRPKHITRTRGQTVAWDVRSTCTGSHIVALTGFAPPANSGKDPDPFEAANKKLTSVPLGGGTNTDTLSAKIKPHGNVDTTYEYKATLDDKDIIDPDLEIWR